MTSGTSATRGDTDKVILQCLAIRAVNLPSPDPLPLGYFNPVSVSVMHQDILETAAWGS